MKATYLSLPSTGNGLGDPCDGDFDGDKVTDYEDACSINHHVTRTDFSRLQKVNLSPFESSSAIKLPIWAVDSTVRRCNSFIDDTDDLSSISPNV